MSDDKKTTPPKSGNGGYPAACTTTPCCDHPVLAAQIIEIKGLYKPGLDDRAVKPPGTTKNSGYQPGYISDDDKGRILRNRDLHGAWSSHNQYIEITVQVDVSPAGCPLPPGTKIKWTIEDPDDPTNDPANVHPDAGQLLDPNDYRGGVKIGAIPNDNDPRGKATATARLEQVAGLYALSGNETLVDPGTKHSIVRFHVSNIGGDNYRIHAEPTHPDARATTPAKTGVMTVWDRIEIEYVKMASANELPVDQISQHYDLACVQVDVSEKRIVTGSLDKPQMGMDDNAAYPKCVLYTSAAHGVFTHEGQGGWFCMVAANRFVPAHRAKILFEGNAKAFGDRVQLPSGTSLSEDPAVVRVFDASKIGGVRSPKPNDYNLHIKFRVASRTGDSLTIVPHDFHLVHDPDNSFLDADLSNYGFANGATIPVQVLGEGDEALVTAGISPPVVIGGKQYFAGRLIVFTATERDPIGTLCHELCHAFDNAHKCGNWDWQNNASRTSCCMNYWFQFVLDNSSPRAPIQWTQNRTSPDLCGPHLVSIRDYHLEDNPGLGWH